MYKHNFHYIYFLDLISATSIIVLLLNEIIFLKKRSSTIWKRSGFHTSSPKNPCIDIYLLGFFLSKYRKNITALTPISENWKPSGFEQVVLVKDKLKP